MPSARTAAHPRTTPAHPHLGLIRQTAIHMAPKTFVVFLASCASPAAGPKVSEEDEDLNRETQLQAILDKKLLVARALLLVTRSY